MNFQSSRDEKKTHVQRVQMQNFLLTKEVARLTSCTRATNCKMGGTGFESDQYTTASHAKQFEAVTIIFSIFKAVL